MDSCSHDVQCVETGWLCGDRSRCVPCEYTWECLNSTVYGAGFSCFQGTCTIGMMNCDPANKDACVSYGWYDLPICGSDGRCRPCLLDEECQIALKDPEAYCDGYCHPFPEDFLEWE